MVECHVANLVHEDLIDGRDGAGAAPDRGAESRPHREHPQDSDVLAAKKENGGKGMRKEDQRFEQRPHGAGRRMRRNRVPETGQRMGNELRVVVLLPRDEPLDRIRAVRRSPVPMTPGQKGAQ